MSVATSSIRRASGPAMSKLGLSGIAPYRDTLLAEVRDRYYRVPGFLPQGGCSFCTGYFGGACPTR